MPDRRLRDGALPASAVGSAPFTELDARRLGPVRRFALRHPVVVDWVVVAVFVLPGVLGAWPYDTPGWWQIGLTLAGGAALFLRRRYPVPVAIAITVLAIATVVTTGYGGNSEFAFAFACYAVAVAYPPTTTWLVVSSTMAAYTGAVLLGQRSLASSSYMVLGAQVSTTAGPTTLGEKVSTIVATLLFSVVGLSIGASVRSRRLHVHDLVERANVLARERDQEGQIATARERTRIAREMHDVVAHALTVMITLADGAKATPDRALADEALDELASTGRSALTDMRRVLGVLRDDDDVPLAPYDDESTLDDVVEPFRRAGMTVRIVRSGPAVALPSTVQHAARRIVTEALTNVLRHAPASPSSQVGVRTTRVEGSTWLELRIANVAGPVEGPARAAGGSGHGIIGMKERAAMYDGTVTAGPTESGWAVVANLRLPEDERPGAGAW